jgi:hypothetical protein
MEDRWSNRIPAPTETRALCPFRILSRGTANEDYKPALWERILAAVCAAAILVVVFIVV